ncbi:helix-turn-helix domain-containing protein [Oscillospiraceae bacterium OttesenSCG-928-F05]|nr:helix-turn-helix domain-containing protein [Oscillospiraceae bacterium OttesenSCG-928-F05]
MIGQRLKQARKHKKLTQQELGALVGVKASAIGMYEQNRRHPKDELILKLSRALDVSTDWLLAGGGEPESAAESLYLHEFISQIEAQLNRQRGLMFDRSEDGSLHILSNEEIDMLCHAIMIGVTVAREKKRSQQSGDTPVQSAQPSHPPDEEPEKK